MTRRLAAAALALALLAAGCGENEGITRGGNVIGTTLTVYSVLPQQGPLAATARDLVDGQKLALAQAGGRAGPYKVNFASLDQSAGENTPEAIRSRAASVARTAIADPQVIAVVADLDSTTARVSVPLFNEAGLLHLSPGATYTGFLAPVSGVPDEPDRWLPSGERTLAPLAPTDAAQGEALARAARGRVAVEAEAGPEAQALAADVRRREPRLVSESRRADTVVYAGSDPASARGAVEAILRENPRADVLLPEALARAGLPGRLGAGRVAALTSAPPPDADPRFAAAFRARFLRAPGPYARVGHDAMRAVIAVLGRRGEKANSRQGAIEDYLRGDAALRAARAPFFLVGPGRYEPVG